MSDNVPALQNQLENCNDLISKNLDNGWADLDPKRKAFAYYYLEDYNHRNAATKAGFSAGMGAKLLREPLLSTFIAEMQNQMAQRSIISRDFVNFQWMRLLPKVMGDEEVELVDKDGTPYLAKSFNANAAAKVLTELSKSTDFYKDGQSSSAAVTVNVNLEALGIKDVGVTVEGEHNG